MKKIALFASGSGTNAQNIISYFRERGGARVALVLCNKPEAGVVERARKLGVPVHLIHSKDLYESDNVLQLLLDQRIDLVVLAGFLKLVPSKIIQAFPGRIINIHPALLPRHGGKGMYGDRVHRAVLDNNERESGITIHYVNEAYDEGEIILQKKCPVKPGDTVSTLKERVHQLEYRYYPRVIEQRLFTKSPETGRL